MRVDPAQHQRRHGRGDEHGDEEGLERQRRSEPLAPRQKPSQRPSQDHDARKQQHNPTAGGGHRAAARASKNGVEPRPRLAQRRRGIENAHMLDVWRDDRAPAGVAGRVSDGLALGRGGIDEPRVLESVRAQKSFPGSGNHQEISRFCPGHRVRKHRNGHGGGDAGIFERAPDDDVGGHRMPEQRHTAIDEGQRQNRIGHAADLALQQLGGPVDARDIPRHGCRVSAVTLEIEGDRDVTGLGEGQRIGFHQLAGPGKAVGDNHRRRLLSVRAPVDGRRRRAHLELRDQQSRPRSFQSPDTDPAEHKTCHKCEQP